jgi:hypothetical protein
MIILNSNANLLSWCGLWWNLLPTQPEESLMFVPGEWVLKSSMEEYKADGVVMSNKIELFLLETSGKFLLSDKARFGYDHIKGTFGCLTIYNQILKKYCYATEETASKLKITFVHARSKLLDILKGHLTHLF